MIEKLILGDRQSGKTTELIKESARTGAYIVVSCKNEARNVFMSAKELGLNIPFPLTVADVMSESPSSYIFQKGILIDDLERVISHLLRYITIHAATVDCTTLEVANVSQDSSIWALSSILPRMRYDYKKYCLSETC